MNDERIDWLYVEFILFNHVIWGNSFTNNDAMDEQLYAELRGWT